MPTSYAEELRSTEPEEVCALIDRLWHWFSDHYQGDYDAIKKWLAFALDQDHYQMGESEKAQSDWTEMRPVTPDLYNLIRHNAASIAKTPLYIEARPVEPSDQPRAEIAKRTLEHDADVKDYLSVRERAIWGGLAGGVWVLKLEVKEDAGPFAGGEIYCSDLDPRRFYVWPGFVDPHDPRCPGVMEIDTMPLHEIRAMRGWKNTDKVEPDSGSASTGPSGDIGRYPGEVRLGSSSGPGDAKRPEEATIIYLWLRNDDTGRQKPAPIVLPPEKWFMECPQCREQDDLTAPDANGMLPELGATCVHCGEGQVKRVTEIDDEVAARKLKRGRLVIVAPHSKQVLYDDRWPWPISTFPYFPLRFYEDPRRYVPMSETAIYWGMAVAIDMVIRMGYEQMIRNVDRIAAVENTLFNSAGEPWTPSNDPNDMMIWVRSQFGLQGAIEHFQGSGLPAAWGTMLQGLQAVFNPNRGMADLGVDPSKSRNIPVGTVQAMVEQAELPIGDKIQRLQRAETKLFKVWHELQRYVWDEPRITRYYGWQEGRFIVESFAGEDIPSSDVVVTASPSFRTTQMETLAQMFQVLGMPKPHRRIAFKYANLPHSDLEEIEAYEAQMMPGAGAPAPPLGGQEVPRPRGRPPRGVREGDVHGRA